MPKSNNWTREELILAFNLYLKIEFGKTHTGNPQVIELAKLIGRTPSSIVFRLGNFASVDPYHQERGVGGLKNGFKQVKPIWDEFHDNQEELVYLSENIRAEKEKVTIEDKYRDILKDLTDLKGETVIQQIKARVNQSVFRTMVLNNYDSRCCITGIEIPKVLVASHILPWSVNEKERLNPMNGLCLNTLHDKAFDKGLITITPDFEVKISEELKSKSDKEGTQDYFLAFEKKKIRVPNRFPPSKEFLEFHNQNIFEQL